MNSLIGVIFKNSKRRDSYNKSTKAESILSVISFIIVFVFLAGLMYFVSVYITRQLAEIDQTYAFVNILLLMNFLLLFAKGIFESLNVLYFSKDSKILLRLPIKPTKILNAKLINMIISEYEMELIMLAIPMMVYGIYMHLGAMFYIYMVLVLLILPIIPIVITSFIISLIMRFTNRIKNKSKVMYITMGIAVLALGIVMMLFEASPNISVSNFEDIILTENGLSDAISDSFILIKPIMNTLLNYDSLVGLGNLVLYILESVVIYKVLVWIMSKVYLKGAIGTTVNSSFGKDNINKDLTIDDFPKKSKAGAYMSKETKILSRTPIFLLQCLILPLAYPIAVFLIMAAFVFFAMQIDIDALGEFYDTLTKSSGQAIFIGIGQVFYMMSFCSIIAVSRESKNAILTKYIPIKLSRQFNLKIRLGTLINLVPAVCTALAYWICTKNPVNSIIMLLILLFVSFICEKFKLMIDLSNPQISWDNEYTMMKQNTNVLYELFYTLIIIGILLLISAVVKNVLLYLIVVLVSSIIVNLALSIYISKKSDRLFRKVF